MLRRIGTEKEITQEIIQALPDDVGRELLRSTIILDYEYDRDRNYLSRGGYSFLAETAEDVAEIGEVIDIVKKHGGENASSDCALRKELVEELADVLMYYNDVLLCYGITADELKQAYTEKFEKNMHRW